MQIIKANKDIAAISVCASVHVCVCQQKQIKHFNDFWPGGVMQGSSPCPSLTLSDNPTIATQKAQKQLIAALLSSQFSSSILNWG